jgi:hypothetical protein
MTILNSNLVAAAAVMTAAESRYTAAIAEWRKCNGFGLEAHEELVESEMSVVTAREEFSHELQLARTTETRAAMFAYLDCAVAALDPEIENGWLRASINRELGTITIRVVAGFGSHYATVQGDYYMDADGLQQMIEDIELNWLG